MSKKVIVIDNRKVLDKILNQMHILGKNVVEVGCLEGEPSPDKSLPLAAIAAVHEYGAIIKNGFGKNITIHIPERSFLRRWTITKKSSINQKILSMVRAVAGGVYTASIALKLLGEFGQGGVKESLLTLKVPPLKPATVRKKGSSKLLIDKAILLNGVRYRIVPIKAIK
jgi:hypothetical protein